MTPTKHKTISLMKLLVFSWISQMPRGALMEDRKWKRLYHNMTHTGG
jgi:hypothetical protein